MVGIKLRRSTCAKIKDIVAEMPASNGVLIIYNDVLKTNGCGTQMEQVHKSLRIGVCCFRRAVLWCNLSGTVNPACYRAIGREAASEQQCNQYGAIGWEQQILLAMGQFTGKQR